MVQIAKIGYAGFNTPDVESMLAYYTDVIGLALVERGADGTAYLRSTAEHHNLILYPSQESGLCHVGFQVDGNQSLKIVADQLRTHGVRVELQSDAQPGVAEQLQFVDTEGNILHLYSSMQEVHGGFPETGIIPEKLGHLAMSVHDVKKCADFYQNVLGFRVSDWIEDFFVFLRCGPEHHTVNFIQTKYQKMHHIAYQLQDWAHVQKACDHLAKHNIPLLWGPGRHGAGHNIFTYHFDPDRQIVELYTELDIMLNEQLGYFEPRLWHEDYPQRPKRWTMAQQPGNKWGIDPSPEFMFMD